MPTNPVVSAGHAEPLTRPFHMHQIAGSSRFSRGNYSVHCHPGNQDTYQANFAHYPIFAKSCSRDANKWANFDMGLISESVLLWSTVTSYSIRSCTSKRYWSSWCESSMECYFCSTATNGGITLSECMHVYCTQSDNLHAGLLIVNPPWVLENEAESGVL